MAERLIAATEDGERVIAVKCLNLPAGSQNCYFCHREKILQVLREDLSSF